MPPANIVAHPGRGAKFSSAQFNDARRTTADAREPKGSALDIAIFIGCQREFRSPSYRELTHVAVHQRIAVGPRAHRDLGIDDAPSEGGAGVPLQGMRPRRRMLWTR
jgi:hypothetical protein